MRNQRGDDGLVVVSEMIGSRMPSGCHFFARRECKVYNYNMVMKTMHMGETAKRFDLNPGTIHMIRR